MFEFSFKWTTPCILQWFIYLRCMFFPWPGLFANGLIYCLVCFVSVVYHVIVCRVSCDGFVSFVYHVTVLCLSCIMWPSLSTMHHSFQWYHRLLGPCYKINAFYEFFCLLENHPIPVCICFDRFSRFIVYFNFILHAVFVVWVHINPVLCLHQRFVSWVPFSAFPCGL